MSDKRERAIQRNEYKRYMILVGLLETIVCDGYDQDGRITKALESAGDSQRDLSNSAWYDRYSCRQSELLAACKDLREWRAEGIHKTVEREELIRRVCDATLAVMREQTT